MSGLVAVTGATGFLGSRLVPALTAAGWRVRVLSRQPGAAWDGPEPEVIAGDLSDLSALRRLTADADLVIHAAGLIGARDRSQFLAVNADGAAVVARAAPPPARVMLISSLAAREPQLSDYAASKRAGEAAMARAVSAERLTILRPPAVYGPGDRATLPLFRFASWSPVLPFLGNPSARLALIHVDDAVRQIVSVAADPISGVFALCDDRAQGYGWREITAALGKAFGRKPAMVSVPPWIIRPVGALSGLAGRLARSAPVFTAGKVREMLHPDWSVGAEEQLPRPCAHRFDLASGFAHTAAWYRANGWLRKARHGHHG